MLCQRSGFDRAHGDALGSITNNKTVHPTPSLRPNSNGWSSQGEDRRLPKPRTNVLVRRSSASAHAQSMFRWRSGSTKPRTRAETGIATRGWLAHGQERTMRRRQMSRVYSLPGDHRANITPFTLQRVFLTRNELIYLCALLCAAYLHHAALEM